MSQVKERPILFSAPMVRAILEGRKTVTRRAVKFPFIDRAVGCELSGNEIGPEEIRNNCPYGVLGQRLWVRETFIDLRGTGVEHRPDPDGPLQRYAYAADCRPGSHSDETRKDFGLKYKPSIHMPRVACRILLEITDVRVQRLQDITEDQAKAEGVCTSAVESFQAAGVDRPAGFAFRDLWTSINGDEGWTANPWVWVVSFRRVTP